MLVLVSVNTSINREMKSDEALRLRFWGARGSLIVPIF